MKYWNKSHKTVMKHWHSVSLSWGEYNSLAQVKLFLQRLPLEGKFYFKSNPGNQRWDGTKWVWDSSPLVIYFQEQKHAVIFKLKWS